MLRFLCKKALLPKRESNARVLSKSAINRFRLFNSSAFHAQHQSLTIGANKRRTAHNNRHVCLFKRHFTKTLFERMTELVPEKQAQCKQILKQVGHEQLSTITVAQAAGGMRGVTALVTDTSLLDINEGIRFRGLSIKDMELKLPKPNARGLQGQYPLPEGMLWLLLTGEIPTLDEVGQLSEELTSSPMCVVPKHTRAIIDDLPSHQHPMSQYITAILSLQTESAFARAYSEKAVKKSEFWKYALHDTMRLVAMIPHISARIYRQSFVDGYVPDITHSKLDWSANWCDMVGINQDESFYDLMRMYFCIHTDHEGGNASAHATHLVSSTLSDIYLSYAAGMCALAGPLHGLANQESLIFVRNIYELYHREGQGRPTEDEIAHFVTNWLESGNVVPGFGHAVLRVTDPRYTIQREFALKFIPESDLFRIVDLLFKVTPGILSKWRGGKVANPWPNLDAISGCLLYEYGLRHDSFYTVLFGMARAIGVGSQYVIDRMLNAPLERPKSISLDAVAKQFHVKL